MGCCITTPKEDDQNTLKTQQNATQESKCKVPPPQPKSPPLIVEEEFVKEILFETETPISSKPQQVPILTQETNTQMQNMEITKDPIMKKPLEEPSEEVSIISETCSVGESYSTTTTATVPETREDEVTSKRRIREANRNQNGLRNHSGGSRKRSYAGERSRNGGREQRRSKSPAKLPEISPEKKVVVGSRLDRRREFSEKVRRDSGEGVRRRSRSPSCQRTVGSSTCRSEIRQTDRAGRRFPPAVKCENEEVVVGRNDGVLMEESLMNPHVSLECFIFL
jgi:hypothetical protein